MPEDTLTAFTHEGIARLVSEDAVLYDLLVKELERQKHTLAMVASSSIVDPSVLVCEGMAAVNVTAEGYPGHRFHAGCEYIDDIERLAIERARRAFKAQYANVQPHSASSANHIVMFSLLKPGDTILGLNLESGGHLTHGAKSSVTGQYFHSISYNVNTDGFIDYEQVFERAVQHQPKLIICGATAYPRVIDFQRFREIADHVGAFLLADITHIAGLVATGIHPSPIDYAHVTTTCTHKQLYGPRGGLILIGNDFEMRVRGNHKNLYQTIQNAVFPFFQGAPAPSAIAAKARCLARVMTPEFKTLTARIVCNARVVANALARKGYKVVSGSSDNHIVLIDLSTKGLTGIVAERALEESSIIVNKNLVPGDKNSALVTSGIRLGTNSVSVRGMEADEMRQIVDLMDQVLAAVRVRDDHSYELNAKIKSRVQAQVKTLCERFAIPNYP